MIISKDLVVSNRKKVDIVEELRQKKFRPFPKVAKAKAAGETEDVEENDDAEEAASGTSTDYDYLLGMAIWSLTKEKVCIPHGRMTLAHSYSLASSLGPQIEKLLQQAADKEKELLALLELTPTQIWNTDLDRFLEEWEVSGQRPPRCLSVRTCVVGMLTPDPYDVTESMQRVGRQVRGRLERQEGQAETSDAQDAEIHRL
jgi:DNA topoisomerase-2